LNNVATADFLPSSELVTEEEGGGGGGGGRGEEAI